MEPSVISFKDFDYMKMKFDPHKAVQVVGRAIRYSSHADIPKHNLTYGSKYEAYAASVLHKMYVDDNDKKQEIERMELFKFWENK